MRFAVVHCSNPKCRLKVWVPENKLGTRGQCPKCGHKIHSPAFVPADELTEGPPIFESAEEPTRRVVEAV
jgi:uncharacterized paraquat-inducible protein A